MRELTDDGKGHTELQFHLTEATLPMLPKSAPPKYCLDHQDHWSSNTLKQEDCGTRTQTDKGRGAPAEAGQGELGLL